MESVQRRLLGSSQEQPIRKPEYLTHVDHQAPKELLESFEYVWNMKGKGIRTHLLVGFNLWLKVEESKLKQITEIVAMLHNASLMVDDIEDGSKMRRGSPSSFAIYGVPTVINTANYIYFLAMEKAMNVGGTETLKILLDEFLNLHRGQGWDIYWRDTHRCPTEEDYRQMVLDKTGGLFRLALRLMSVLSENKQDYIPLVNLLGLYYQIRDDQLNLLSDAFTKNKCFAEDLSEGKYSFPIIHGLQHRKDQQLELILKQRTTDDDIKKHAINLMKEVGSFEYTQKVLDGLLVEIKESIKQFGGNKNLEALVEQLSSTDV